MLIIHLSRSRGVENAAGASSELLSLSLILGGFLEFFAEDKPDIQGNNIGLLV